MFILYLAFLGILVFTLGVWLIGLWLRQHPSKVNAEKSSRVVHFLFFAGLGAPFLISILYPGFAHLDGLIGLNPLRFKLFFTIIGIVAVIPGLYFLGVSFKIGAYCRRRSQCFPPDKAGCCTGCLQTHSESYVVGILFILSQRGFHFWFNASNSLYSIGNYSSSSLFPQIL